VENDEFVPSLQIEIQTEGETIPNGKNEIYSLKISAESATLTGSSIFGVMRGLETFRQLVNVVGYDKRYCPHVDNVPVEIHDEPRSAFRGIMLDLARNYYTLPFIKNIIQLMGNVIY
jgi:hexosaminidase